MKDCNFISDDRLHKTRFCKKKGGGANQNFPHKEGGWSKREGLGRFRILKRGLPKKRGDFLRGEFIPWCLQCYPEIIQTSTLGRLQKKSLEHSDCLYVASVISLVHKITFREIVEVSLEQHWDNLFERNFANLNMFLHTGLTELDMFFITRSTPFFSSTAQLSSKFSG